MPRTLVVAAAIVDDLGHPRRLLACRRTAPASLAGRWELPGGKVEASESPEEALRRELAEELGIGVRLGLELTGPDAGRWPLAPGAVLRVWLAEVTDGRPTALQDHDLVRWLKPGDWLGVDWLPGDRPIVQSLLAAGGGGGPPARMDQGPAPAP